MKITKVFSYFGLMIILSCAVVACGGGQGGQGSSNDKAITFWAAPNPPQQAFWTQMAKDYMAKNPGVTITVKPIAETPSSEASIQSALAGGTAPTASENIFTGFGSTLVQSQAVVPLDQMPGWSDLIKARNMEQTIQSWKFSDGHTYILPMYTNSMLVAWRSDILKQLGYSQPPKTYSQVLDLGKKLKAKFPNKYVWADSDLGKDTWYARWADFFTFYDAASNGHSFISGNKFTDDDNASVQTLTFFQQLAQENQLLTQTVTDPFENGNSLMEVIGPWTFTTWQQKYPNLKYNDTYTLAPPPVPDNMANTSAVKTFADAKGIVIYKQSSQQQQQEMWSFVKWVLSDPSHDLTWLNTTAEPPARDDLSTNPLFASYFTKNPELVPFAANIANSIPPFTNPNYTTIQQSLGDNALIPVIKGQAAPADAWNKWKSSTQSTLGN
jgi:multiple sugar transport system substrate-binding protein